MRGIYDRGLALPRRQLVDRPSYASEGKLTIGGATDERLVSVQRWPAPHLPRARWRGLGVHSVRANPRDHRPR